MFTFKQYLIEIANTPAGQQHLDDFAKQHSQRMRNLAGAYSKLRHDHRNQEEFRRAVDDVHAYFHDYEKDSRFDRSVDLLIQYPKYQYRGKMYRALLFDPAKIREMTDTRVIMSRMHEWVVKFPGEAQYKYFSWAPTLATLQASLNTNLKSSIYDDDLAPFPFFILQQRNVGVRVKNVIQINPGFEGEDEIFAEMSSNAHLIGFYLGDATGYIDGPQSSGRYYPVSKLKEFVRAFRPQDREWERARRGII